MKTNSTLGAAVLLPKRPDHFGTPTKPRHQGRQRSTQVKGQEDLVATRRGTWSDANSHVELRETWHFKGTGLGSLCLSQRVLCLSLALSERSIWMVPTCSNSSGSEHHSHFVRTSRNVPFCLLLRFFPPLGIVRPLFHCENVIRFTEHPVIRKSHRSQAKDGSSDSPSGKTPNPRWRGSIRSHRSREASSREQTTVTGPSRLLPRQPSPHPMGRCEGQTWMNIHRHRWLFMDIFQGFPWFMNIAHTKNRNLVFGSRLVNVVEVKRFGRPMSKPPNL